MAFKSVLSWSLAVALFSVASVSHAQTAAKTQDFTVRTDVTTVSVNGGQSLKWDARRGRWGVTLNLNQPAERGPVWSDVQAGAYYRLTPSLRIGGVVALGDQPVLPVYKKTEPRDSAPRVRLETAFKF
ncbi:MAG: hypothetical protein CGW95_15775 [Phenylobacterium zucineum]|nr:MAG: hypothetical protein CGW95_15775 [Phenylobacterium zucineum]